jgi:hypothetical protein
MAQVDFNEYDRVSREIPIPRASIEAIKRTGVPIRDGLQLGLYSADLDDAGNPADLVVDGRIHFDAEADLWVARVNPATFRHVACHEPVPQPDGLKVTPAPRGGPA